MYTLMHDTQYREAIAWQNVGYNQPPNPSFYLGDGMSPPPVPDIYLVQYTGPALAMDRWWPRLPREFCRWESDLQFCCSIFD